MELCERLEASKGAYAAEEQRMEELVVAAAKRDQLHTKKLAKAEGQRAEEEQIAKDLCEQIAATKTEQVEFWRRVAKVTGDRDKEFKSTEELMASLANVHQKHAGELTDWAKKLADCEAARPLEVKCKVKFKSECGRLQGQLKLVAMHLE